jgi:hypothetical protein
MICSSTPAVRDPFLDFCDSLAGIESLWTSAGAVQNGVAPIKAERIFKSIESPASRFVAAVGQPAPRLQEDGRSQEAIAVPPVAWAAGGTAEAKNTLIIAVQSFSILGRLQPLSVWIGRLGLKPRFNQFVLRV